LLKQAFLHGLARQGKGEGRKAKVKILSTFDFPNIMYLPGIKSKAYEELNDDSFFYSWYINEGYLLRNHVLQGHLYPSSRSKKRRQRFANDENILKNLTPFAFAPKFVVGTFRKETELELKQSGVRKFDTKRVAIFSHKSI
jgi:hypothetical protein